MKFFDKIKRVITQPTRFFHEIQKEKGIGPAFIYYLIFLIIVIALSSIYYIGSISKMPTAAMFGGAMVAGMIIANFVFSLIGIFIIIGIIHLFCRLVKGKGEFPDTFKALVYGATPSLIFSPIFMLIFGILSLFVKPGPQTMEALLPVFVIMFPFGFAIAIWSLVLEIKGIKILHKISTWRAVAAVLILPILLIIIIAVIILLIILALVGTLMAAL